MLSQLDRWKPRKGSKPASSDDLSAQGDALSIEITALEAERSQIDDALPALITSDPAHAAEASGRLLAISLELPTKRRTLEIIATAVAEAERREACAAVEVRVEAQRRASAKLAKDLEQRYRAAAEAFVAVLAVIQADADACERMNIEAREHGLTGLWSAEFQLRKDFSTGSTGFATLASVQVGSWEGGFGYPMRVPAR